MRTITHAKRLNHGPSLEQLQRQFLALLPRIESQAGNCFAYLRCPAERADKIAETVALAWKAYLRLIETGKDMSQFVATFTFFVARSVKCGRLLAGMIKSKDVLNPQAQKRFGFKVETLPQSTSRFSREPHGQRQQDAFERRLQDNRITPVPEQVAFRIDFSRWYGTRCRRDRAIIGCMLLDERTQDLSRKFGISPSRVSQLRREFYLDWLRFQGEHLETATTRT